MEKREIQIKEQCECERWEYHQRIFDAKVLQLLYRELAERQADYEAEHDNPKMQRYYAGEILTLQCQIKHMMKRWEPEARPGPIVITAKKPRKKKRRLLLIDQRALSSDQ